MAAGIEVYDGTGTLTLGRSDFTLEKIFQTEIPKSFSSPANGHRSDYILLNVPGYTPASCFVIITPLVYANYDQPGSDDGWGFTPTYIELGNGQIGIITYNNASYYQSDRWFDVHQFNSVRSLVEVVRVF